MYQGKYDEASAELQKLTDKARSDGERRTALIGQMALAADRGNLQQALTEVDKQYALGQKSNEFRRWLAINNLREIFCLRWVR